MTKKKSKNKPAVETYKQGGEWKNKVQGNSRASSKHPGRDEAIASGRKMAEDRKTEHIIKTAEGKISKKHSHGNDPSDTKG